MSEAVPPSSMNGSMNAFVGALRQHRSYSIWDICSFVLNFVVTFVVIGLGLYTPVILRLQGQPTIQQWQIIIATAFLLVIFTYVRERFVTRKKEQQLRGSKVVYDCIGAAVERLIDSQACSSMEVSQYVPELLRYIEKVIVLVLQDSGVPQGEICANLMIRKDNPDRLELEHFGTYLPGRSKRILPLDLNNLLPGAPEACVGQKVIYIDNTLSEANRRFFDEAKPYRSILSIPIPSELARGKVFGVLNVDSPCPNQFVSRDFIGKKVLPVLTPFVALVTLERKLVKSD